MIRTRVIVLAALCVAIAAARAAAAAPPAVTALAPLLTRALPPAPTTVERESKMYGDVRFDHAAHLARRVACVECHGPGPVHRIDFTPRLAHDRCRGCHLKVARGPTDCRGCHAVEKPEEAVAMVAAPQPAPAAPAPPSRLEVLAALSPEVAPPAFHRTVEYGFTTVLASGELLHGPTVHLVGHYGADLLAYSLSIPGGTDGRVQFLVGAGRELALSPRWRWSALGLAGIDASLDPSMVLPGLGARIAIELSTPWRSVRSMSLQMTALTDVVSSPDAGRHAGDVSVGLSLVAGSRVSR